MLLDFITNEVLIILLCVWKLAQILKMLIAVIKRNGFALDYLFNSGDMPGVHSAMVSASAITAGMT